GVAVPSWVRRRNGAAESGQREPRRDKTLEQGGGTMKGRALLASLAGGLIATMVVADGPASANHVRIALVPATTNAQSVVVPETLQVDGITARQVRAHAIYANRIDADQVQGMIHQISGLQNLYGHGQIQASDVSASVIYADTISANFVTADAVYVRDL